MKLRLLVLMLSGLIPGLTLAADYYWGGAGSAESLVWWNDTDATDGDGTNSDLSHWSNPIAPIENGVDNITIASGGVQKSALTLDGPSKLFLLGDAYFYSTNSDVGKNSTGAVYVLNGAFHNAQYLRCYGGSTLDIISGRVNLRGTGDPLPSGGVGGFLNFSGNNGRLTTAKTQAWLEGKILAGIVRIDGQIITTITNGVSEEVNGKSFVMDGANLTLVSRQIPHDPAPSDGAIDVPLDQTLSWYTGKDPGDISKTNPAIQKHYVLMSDGSLDDPNLYLVHTIDAQSPPAEILTYTPTGLMRDKTYLWQIQDALPDGQGGVYSPGDPNNLSGPVWSFDTVLSVPVIDEQPALTLVDEDMTAEISLSASNPLLGDTTGLSYQWYLAGDNDIEVGTNSPQLSIPGATIANEGQYYCQVKIDSNGKTTDSDLAWLIIKRQIAHYPLDEDPNDIVGSGKGVIAGNPIYSTGLIGSGSLEMAGEPDGLSVPADRILSPNWTISIWTWETAEADHNGYILASGDPEGFESFFIRRWQNTLNNFVGGFANGSFDAFGPYDRGAWHLHTVTYDGVTDTARWYVDGEVQDETTQTGYTGLDTAIFVGGRKTHPADDNTRYFIGKLDDLQIYNYPLDPFAIAEMYANTTGQPACAGYIQQDLNRDCQVDLEDLIRFLVNWMDCNIVPDCIE